MNLQSTIARREPVKLTVSSFMLLRRGGAFSAYAKSELLDGALWGVMRQPDDEPESDASVPIRLTVDHYETLDQAGAFATMAKTELVDGLVYAMSPQHRPHGFAKDELAYRLRRALEQAASPLHVATEQSVAILPFSQPQPDIVLTSEPRGPGPIPIQSVALIVEISASTYRFDIGEKARVYAAAGVAEYWVVDIGAGAIHGMWAPEAGAYISSVLTRFGDVMTSATLSGIAIDTAGLD